MSLDLPGIKIKRKKSELMLWPVLVKKNPKLGKKKVTDCDEVR